MSIRKDSESHRDFLYRNMQDPGRTKSMTRSIEKTVDAARRLQDDELDHMKHEEEEVAQQHMKLSRKASEASRACAVSAFVQRASVMVAKELRDNVSQVTAPWSPSPQMSERDARGRNYTIVVWPRARTESSGEEDELDESDPEEDAASKEEGNMQWPKMETLSDPEQQIFYEVCKIILLITDATDSTVITALALLGQRDLQSAPALVAIHQYKALEMLVNLLSVKNEAVRIGVLRVLLNLAGDRRARSPLISLGIVSSLVRSLASTSRAESTHAARALAAVCRDTYARTHVRRVGGLGQLIEILGRVPDNVLLLAPPGEDDEEGTEHQKSLTSLRRSLQYNVYQQPGFQRQERRSAGRSKQQRESRLRLKLMRKGLPYFTGSQIDGPKDISADDGAELELAVACAWAMREAARAPRNRTTLVRGGAGSVITRIMCTERRELIAPVVGVIKELSPEHAFQEALLTGSVLGRLVHFLGDDDRNVKLNCAEAIFSLAENEDSRLQVRLHGGLKTLVRLLKTEFKLQAESTTGWDMALTVAITGGLWKLCQDPENALALSAIPGVIKILQQCLVEATDADVEAHVAGTLSLMANVRGVAASMRESATIPVLVEMVRGGPPINMQNAADALAAMAPADHDSALVIDNLGGVELLWSLLKQPFPGVQAAGARAVAAMLRVLVNPGEVVRTVVGGMELTLQVLIAARDYGVLSAICELIAEICKDEENLTIVSDLGLVMVLSERWFLRDMKLRSALAAAVGYVAGLPENRRLLGRLGAVGVLVMYLKLGDEVVKRWAVFALSQLSRDPFNCFLMVDIIPQFIEAAHSDDKNVQEYAAMAMRNVRLLALDADLYSTVFLPESVLAREAYSLTNMRRLLREAKWPLEAMKAEQEKARGRMNH